MPDCPRGGCCMHDHQVGEAEEALDVGENELSAGRERASMSWDGSLSDRLASIPPPPYDQACRG